jgi:hypothetical protein
MQAIRAGYNGLWLLLDVNRDRMIYVATIIAGLLFGAFVGTLATGM